MMARVSNILAGLFDKRQESDADELTIREIMEMLHELGFGVIILMFALPAIVPGLPPPIHTLVAIPLIVLGWQMMLGFDSVKLPEMVAKRKIKRSSLQKAVQKSEKYLKVVERFTRPRMDFMNTPMGGRFVGLMVLLFAVTVAIPAPLTNTVPGIAIAMVGIAYLEKDGLLAIAGSILGLAWMAALALFSAVMIAFVYGFFS
jgi:hypothetical protein